MSCFCSCLCSSIIRLQKDEKGRRRRTLSILCIYYELNAFPEFISLHASRDGKNLENSTCKAWSLKNQHTKYVPKMLKILQKGAKIQKLHKKGKNLLKSRYKTKIQHSCDKLAQAARLLRSPFSISASQQSDLNMFISSQKLTEG